MKLIHSFRYSLLLGLALLLSVTALSLWYCSKNAQAASDPYVIGAVFDITGSQSPLGTPERDTVTMLENQINARGGINGHPLKVIIYDNGSDGTRSMLAMKRLIESDHVLAIIGPSSTGTTLAGAKTVEDARVPLVSCAAGVAIVSPVHHWIFKTAQSDVHAVAKVFDYLRSQHLQKIAIISVSNAFGDSGKQQLNLQARAAGITIVEQQSFGDSDTDMTAQLMRIRGSGAQAVVCWGTNPGPAIVAKNMRTLGIRLPLVMSHGIANRKFIELAGPAANGVVFPAGKLLVANSLSTADVQKKALLAYAASFKATYKKDADTFGGHAYDAFQLVCTALKKVGPDREKIRAALEKSRYAGISGVFTFTPGDHNGLAKNAFVMVKIENGAWTLVK